MRAPNIDTMVHIPVQIKGLLIGALVGFIIAILYGVSLKFIPVLMFFFSIPGVLIGLTMVSGKDANTLGRYWMMNSAINNVGSVARSAMYAFR